MSPVADAAFLAASEGLTLIDWDRAAPALSQAAPIHPVVSARLPMEAAEAGRLHVFRPEDGGEEHYAIEIGHPPRDTPVLARLHSACFTGDLLGSLKCDCGPQLRAALAQMGTEGAGILLYLNQEGRGIGLANKMRAYSLQDQGFDTVEANHRLGFEDDERDFRLGAALLKKLGFSAVRLLTNNPAKIRMMEANGIAVAERVPLKVGQTRPQRGLPRHQGEEVRPPAVSAADLVLTPTGLRFLGRTFPVSIGRSGIATDKREGDGATPAGIHRVIGLLYRPDRIAARSLPRLGRYRSTSKTAGATRPAIRPTTTSSANLSARARNASAAPIRSTIWCCRSTGTGPTLCPARAPRSSSTSGAAPAIRPPAAWPSRGPT